MVSIRREILLITLVWVLASLGLYNNNKIEASSSLAVAAAETECLASSCGSISNISYPFRLKGHDPPHCGDPRYELSCENNRTTLYLYSLKFYVLSISYDQYLSISYDQYLSISYDQYFGSNIRLVDANLVRNVCYVPPYSIRLPCHYSYAGSILLLNCTEHQLAETYSSKYIDASSCIISNSSSSHNSYLYALSYNSTLADIRESCYVQARWPVPSPYAYNTSTTYDAIYDTTGKTIIDIYQDLQMGFTLLTTEPYRCESGLSLKWRIAYFFMDLWFNHRRQLIAFIASLGGLFIGRISVGLLCLLAICTYKFRQRHSSVDYTIEQFLRSHNNLMPIRYSYSEIKQMAKGFRHKLGQGGYGSVFKGKLRSGHLVAIKVLNKSKANGQDFINEVATIGRIHHVNVVRLIGFCADGSKRALVYEFLPNGSLDTFIFSTKGKNTSLDWETMHDITLGVARGIEYLHRGCDMQILHFDIKPHNILLDQNFVPKVSDFGLAKLYPVDDSIVPDLTAARGTLGYIAPELFYKNIGSVSYKADVYSFGMLLMEVVGRRKNLNAFTEHTSKIYFPSWIYDRINQGENLELGDATESETQIVRKLLIVAFWCIQMNPADRPSMGKVLEMLQGEVEFLQMPSKPFLNPQELDVK